MYVQHFEWNDWIDQMNSHSIFLVHGGMGGQQGVNTIDMERTLKSLNGYHEVEVRILSFRYYYLDNCNHIWVINNQTKPPV